MPTRPLANNPSLEHLRKEAKRLFKAVRDGDADALARVKEFHPRATGAGVHWTLADAQLVTARSYGFASWTDLKEYVVAIEPFVWSTPPPPDSGTSLADTFVRLACLVYDDWQRTNVAKAQRLLADHPEIAAPTSTLLPPPEMSRMCERCWISIQRSSMPRAVRFIQELCWAAMHNFPQRVKLLVEHRVDVNARSPRDGRTAYEAARREGHDDIADYLAAHGARRIEPSAAETFSVACIHGRRAEVQAMLAADPGLLDRMSTEDRLGLFHRAIAANERDGVRLIVELGVDVNGMLPNTGLDRAPLHSAAGGGDLEMGKLLIDLGADPRLRDYAFHAAPIGWAKYGQHQAVVDYLFRYASIFDAVHLGGAERAESLLEQSPSLAQVRDDDGDPLAFYLYPDMERLDEMIALLTKHGVDLSAAGRGGVTLLDRALAHRWAEFADVLRRHGAQTS